MVVAEAAMVFVPAMPENAGIALVVAALLGGMVSTLWVAKRNKDYAHV